MGVTGKNEHFFVLLHSFKKNAWKNLQKLR